MAEIKEKFLKDYTPPAFLIPKVDLDFIIDEEYVDVLSVMSVEKKDLSQNDLILDALDLDLQACFINGVRLLEERFEVRDESLVIKNVPQNFELTIKNRIYPHKNTELEGLYKSGDILCTQCEPEGFRRITPFVDRPDNMCVFTTTITAKKEHFPVLLSNGNKTNEREIGDKLEVTWEDPFPKPSYLFALVAGDLGCVSNRFTTRSGRKVALNIYTDKGDESKCHYAMESLKKAMKWDEEVYEREYDLDIYNIVAIHSFNMGAMENKGLNIFNSAYVLADSEVATDRDFMGIESVIAHEYFHNWTGNRITCRDWFQLTLKEGLTVFRDQCFSADMNSFDVQRIEDVKALRERQFVEDASPMRHPIQPKSYISMNNFYTATVYEKGAEVTRMIYTLLGKEGFKKGMDVYFKTFDGQAVTTEDFIWAMEEGSGVDLAQFRRWYHQSGTPRLIVEEEFVDGIYSISFTQIIPDDTAGNPQDVLYYPLNMVLFDAKTGEIKEEKQLIIKDKTQRFEFGGFDSKPVLSLNRDFSAPVIIEHEANYPFLAKFDTNGFTRFEALTQFAMKCVHDIVEEKPIDETFFDVYETILQSELVLLYKALLLELPSLVNVIASLDEIDIHKYADALERLDIAVTRRFEKEFKALYVKHHKPENSRLDATSKGERALKNLALEMLGSLKTDEVFTLAKEQYEDSKNMGDKLTALKVMDSIDHKSAKTFLDDFYQRYKENQLLMVKYFSIQASLDNEFVLGRIKELEKDKKFSQEVPNLVRALYGVFSRNLKQFHKKDGSGYRFMTEKIMEIDKINPQMAAALANSFKLYEKINDTNRKLMRETLENILNCEGLSQNCYEIVSKTLGTK